MNDRTRRRLAGLAIVGLGLVLATIAVAASANQLRSDGPLATTTQTETEFALDDGQVATWGMPISNLTASDIEVEGVDLVDVTGLEILGISAHDPVDGHGIGTAYGYPPAEVVTSSISGWIIRPHDGDGSVLDVLVGVRLTPGASNAGVGGLRVRYNSAGNDHETVLPWSLRINRDGS